MSKTTCKNTMVFIEHSLAIYNYIFNPLTAQKEIYLNRYSTSVQPWTFAAQGWPHYFLSSLPIAAYMRQRIGSTLVHIMVYRLFGTLSKPMLGYHQWGPKEQTAVKFSSKYKILLSQKRIRIYHLRNGCHFLHWGWGGVGVGVGVVWGWGGGWMCVGCVWGGGGGGGNLICI